MTIGPGRNSSIDGKKAGSHRGEIASLGGQGRLSDPTQRLIHFARKMVLSKALY